MTEPTYSELEAELLRVRGLLQRIADAYRTPICTHARMMPVVGQCVCCEREGKVKLKLAIEEALFLSIPDWPQGAESADIGKLDAADKLGKFIDDSIDAMTPEQLAKFRKDSAAIMEKSRAGADKSGVEMGKVNRVDEMNGLLLQMRLSCITPDCPNCPKYEERSAMVQELARIKLAGSAETGGEKAAPVGKSLRKQWRSYRRRVKRAVLAQMPYREAGEWAADMLQITPLPTDSKTKKFAVEFCKIAIKTYEHKEDAEAFQKELHRILRRKLRYYAAQEKRALMCKLAFKDRNPEPNFPRTSQNQTVSSGVEGAHEGTTADKSELLPTQLPKSDL